MSEKNVDLIEGEGHDIVDITELINPFPGLRPFGVEEAHLFFGREGQSDEVLMKLSENKFVAILGASGSGKSSFMYCGLIPSLMGGFMTEAGSNWRVVVSRPGGGPIDNLAESLMIRDKSTANLSEEDRLIKRTILGTVLRSSSLGLIEVVRQMKTEDDQNVLVVIDQFEELFRFRKLEEATSDLDESSAFVNLLLEAIHQYEEPIYVALTMRSDFIGECAKFPDLTQMINDSHYLIPQMTRDQKRMAVEGPVAVGGGKLAPRLTQQLLNDVGDNPDQLPILQHALMRTWTYWVDNRRQGEPMDLRHYNAIGTLREALSQHANEAYDSLSKREKEICEVMFKSLTERGSENQGIRRPTKLSTIAAIAGVTEDEVVRVVEKFREPGRSLLMPPYGIRLESETVIDISHESLMRIWDRLKRWLDEESKAAEMYMKLSEAAERFQEGKASLWKMPDLQLAINWREENRPTLVWGQRYNPAFERTMVFLETSEKAYITEQKNRELLQKRQVKRMRISAIILGAAALVSIFGVVFSYIKAQEAEKQRIAAVALQDLANKNAEDAKKQTELANQRSVEAERDRNRATEALTQAEQAKEQAEASAALARSETARANEALRDAEIARQAAAKSAEDAKVEAENAKRAQNEALLAKANADRLRLQSIASSMAIKSKNIHDDQFSGAELKAIVAYQAYLFFEENKDANRPYNGDIYSGVYHGLVGVLSDFDSVGKSQNNGSKKLNHYEGHKHKSAIAADQKIAVRSVVYSKDGARLYSAGSDGRLLQWDMGNGQRKYKEVFQNTSFQINRVVNVSPNERYLAVGTQQENIMVVDLQSAIAGPRTIAGHIGGTVFDLVFLPDNQRFVTVGVDRRILLHSLDNTAPQEVAKLDVASKTIAVTPDGNLLAAGTDDGRILLFDLSSPQFTQRTITRKDKSMVSAIDFNARGNLVAFGDKSGEVVIFDLLGRKKYGPTLTGFTGSISDVQFSPNDSLLVATSSDYTARMWDMANIYDLPTIFDDHQDWVWSLDFHPGSQRFATGSADGIVRVFEVKPDAYAEQICALVSRNMNDTEWRQYVGDPEEIPYRLTCPGLKKGEEND